MNESSKDGQYFKYLTNGDIFRYPQYFPRRKYKAGIKDASLILSYLLGDRF